MLKILLFLLSMIISNSLLSQSLTASFGPIFTKTNANPPVINGKEDFENTDYMFAFSYEHFFKNKKYSLTGSYSKYDGCTFILFEEGGYIGGGGTILAKGYCGGVDINRYDLGVSYLLTKSNKKIYVKPFLGAALQVTCKTGWDYWSDDGLPVNGPDYFELEPISGEAKNTTQIVPTVGLRMGFVFWERIDFGLSVQGVYAFKPYQKMALKYHYKGVIQPTAEYESTGTGLFVTLGVGYRFAKLIK